MRLLNVLAAGVALSLGASAAFAAPPVAPTSPPVAGPVPTGGLTGTQPGNSGIIVSVWDTAAKVSLVQYLGVSLNDFLPGETNATPNAGLHLDFGTLGATSGPNTFASLFGSTQASNLVYWITAYDGTAVPGESVNGKQLLTTLANPATQFNTGSLDGAVNNVNGFFASVVSACGTTNPCVVAEGNAGYAGSLGTSYSQPIGDASTTVGSPLGFYLASAIDDFADNTAVTRYKNGNGDFAAWSLDSAGHLKYDIGPVSAVPLPAAVWLLLSGLAGMGVVGRRKVA